MSLLLANQAGGGSPLTGTPASAIRSWVLPAIAVLLGAVTASPASAARQWVNPAPSVTVGAVVATPAPATRAWAVPTPGVAFGDVVAAPAPATRTWVVPQAAVTLDLTTIPAPAVRAWVTLDASLPVVGPVAEKSLNAFGLNAAPRSSGPAAQTASPIPAVRTWVTLDAVFGEVVEPPFSGGGGYTPPYKHPGWNVIVTVPPAIRDWVVPQVRVRLGDVRLLPDPAQGRWEVLEPTALTALAVLALPASRQWIVLSPDVLVAPDPDEEMLILLLSTIPQRT